MRRNRVTLAIILFGLITVIGSLVWMYLINIYEVKFVPSNKSLVADEASVINIDVIPLNSFGDKALFRSIKADFYIESGSELIEIISSEKDTESFTIKSKNSEGEVVILIKCKMSLIPIKIHIPIISKNIENYS